MAARWRRPCPYRRHRGVRFAVSLTSAGRLNGLAPAGGARSRRTWRFAPTDRWLPWDHSTAPCPSSTSKAVSVFAPVPRPEGSLRRLLARRQDDRRRQPAGPGQAVGRRHRTQAADAQGSGKPLRALCYSPDCKVIVTAGGEGVVTFWDVARARAARRSTGASARICRCASRPTACARRRRRSGASWVWGRGRVGGVRSGGNLPVCRSCSGVRREASLWLSFWIRRLRVAFPLSQGVLDPERNPKRRFTSALQNNLTSPSPP